MLRAILATPSQPLAAPQALKVERAQTSPIPLFEASKTGLWRPHSTVRFPPQSRTIRFPPPPIPKKGTQDT